MKTDFTKKNPAIRKPLHIDHETGHIDIPNFGRLPLVGPTSGSEYEALKASDRAKDAFNRRLLELMSAVYVCVQCKRRVKGHLAIVGWNEREQREVLACPHKLTEGRCRGDLVPCRA